LVLGGTGLLGSNTKELVSALLENPQDITVEEATKTLEEK